jgi:hypothetical protein
MKVRFILITLCCEPTSIYAILQNSTTQSDQEMKNVGWLTYPSCFFSYTRYKIGREVLDDEICRSIV